jgi:hypothetical protein
MSYIRYFIFILLILFTLPSEALSAPIKLVTTTDSKEIKIKESRFLVGTQSSVEYTYDDNYLSIKIHYGIVFLFIKDIHVNVNCGSGFLNYTKESVFLINYVPENKLIYVRVFEGIVILPNPQLLLEKSIQIALVKSIQYESNGAFLIKSEVRND